MVLFMSINVLQWDRLFIHPFPIFVYYTCKCLKCYCHKVGFKSGRLFAAREEGAGNGDGDLEGGFVE